MILPIHGLAQTGHSQHSAKWANTDYNSRLSGIRKESVSASVKVSISQ